MSLSNDLVSKFAKMNKENNKTPSETIVYGTAVAYGDKVYVNLDGSDSVTPVTSTAEVKAGERVTVLLKDHSATILGNISNPSASTETTNKILDDYDVIVAKIGNFELLIADTVTTKQLEAELAIINEALIGKATIAELEAMYADIENLHVKRLDAEIAEIDKALILKADITELDALKANVSNLDADLAEITTLIGGNLTMDNIQSLVLTSSKVTVDNAFIKDAMIDRVSASKLTAGTINTSLVDIGSEDGTMSITGSLQQFKDADGNVRIQIGKDSTGDFTFALYGADGQGQLINQNGITASAIEDGLIVNKMVADNANISGSKLDIDSVIETINDEGTKTILGTKVYLDEQDQSLEVAFKQLHTTVEDDIKEQITTNTTNMEVMQGEINSLISNTTITKENGVVVNLKDELNAVIDTVDSHSQTISTLETNYDDVSGEIETVNSTVSKMEQDLDGFEQSITTTITGLETRVQSAEQKITNDSIVSVVTSSTEWTNQANTISGFQSSINQNADKISWMIKSGTSASNMVLTDRMLTIIADNIDLTGKVSFNSFDNTVITNMEDLASYAVSNTTIYGNQIATGTIQAHHIATYALTADQIAANTITSAEIAAGAIRASEIASGAITADKIAAGAVTADKIATRSLTVDKISSNNENPVITLFDNCEIDASYLNGQGKGNAIRFKWDDYNYVYQAENLFALFQSSGGEVKIFSVTADSSATYLYNKNQYALTLGSSLAYRGSTVLTAGNYSSYCASSSHSHSGYASSSHSHSGYASSSHSHSDYMPTDSSTTVWTGSHSPYYSNSYNLGWSQERWQQMCAKDVFADYCSASDISLKENIRYIKPSNMTTFARDGEIDETIKPNEARNINLGVSGVDLYEFVKNDLKLCEYNYTDDYNTNTATNEVIRSNFDNKIGFVAQDLESSYVGNLIVGEWEGILSYNLNNYVSVLGGALQYDIMLRDEQIAILENTIADLEARINALENNK